MIERNWHNQKLMDYCLYNIQSLRFQLGNKLNLN